MKFRIILISLSFSFFFKLNAQNVSYGIYAGPSARNISFGSSSIFNHHEIGADVGAFAEFRFSEKISLQPNIAFSAQGSKHGSFFSTTNYSSEQFKGGVKFGEPNYLMIPILAKLSWALGYRSPVKFFLSAGPYLATLISANQILINNQGDKLQGSSVDVKSQLRSLSAGGEGNIGLSYFFRLSSLSLQAGGTYGFVKLQKNSATSGGNYPGSVAAVVIYSFWIDDNFLTNWHIRPKR